MKKNEYNGNWIKLHRKLQDWDWSNDPNTFCLFIHILMLANYKETTWRGYALSAGQLITGRKQLSEITGLSERQVRTGLTRLQTTSQLSVKTTNRFSVITVTNWKKYQNNDQVNDQPAVRQTTTSKNIKEEKNLSTNIFEIKKTISTLGRNANGEARAHLGNEVYEKITSYKSWESWCDTKSDYVEYELSKALKNT